MHEKPTYEELMQRVQELELIEFELKKTEKALKESEDRYQRILQNSPGMICSFIPGGEITFVNKSYCDYFDKTFDELVGSNFQLLIPEADRQKVMANISALSAESPTQSHEHSVIAPNGEIRWQCWINRALFNPQGQIIEYQSIGEDITERKRSEEALRESEERFRIFAEESPFGIALIDTKGCYQYINSKFTDTFGYELEDIPLGKEWFKKAYPDEKIRRQVISTWKKDQEESGIGEPRSRTYTVRCKNGSEKIINFIPVTMNTGDQFMICEDVTVAKKYEAEREQLITDLETALDEIKTLRGFLLICSSCKKIRIDSNNWEQIEVYILKHSEARLSHGICPECVRKLYPGYNIFDDVEDMSDVSSGHKQL